MFPYVYFFYFSSDYANKIKQKQKKKIAKNNFFLGVQQKKVVNKFRVLFEGRIKAILRSWNDLCD